MVDDMVGKWEDEDAVAYIAPAPAHSVIEPDDDINPMIDIPIQDLGDMVKDGIPKLLSMALGKAMSGGEVKEIVPVLGMALKLAEAREANKGVEWKVTVQWVDSSVGTE